MYIKRQEGDNKILAKKKHKNKVLNNTTTAIKNHYSLMYGCLRKKCFPTTCPLSKKENPSQVYFHTPFFLHIGKKLTTGYVLKRKINLKKYLK